MAVVFTGAPRVPRRMMTPPRRFLAAVIAATALTWVLGDARILWQELGWFTPGTAGGAGAPTVLDGRGGRAIERLEIPLPADPGSGAVHVAAAAGIEALDPHPASVYVHPAVVQLRFFAGAERLDLSHVAYLERGGTRVSGDKRVTVPPGTDRVELALIVRTGAGRHRFDVAPVSYAERHSLYLVGAALLAVVWAMLAARLLRAAARTGAGRLVRHACIATLVLIVVGTGLSTSVPLAGASQLLRDGLADAAGRRAGRARAAVRRGALRRASR